MIRLSALELINLGMGRGIPVTIETTNPNPTKKGLANYQANNNTNTYHRLFSEATRTIYHLMVMICQLPQNARSTPELPESLSHPGNYDELLLKNTNSINSPLNHHRLTKIWRR